MHQIRGDAPMHIVLVGAGALGSQICSEFLTMPLGSIARVTIVDPDILQSHNVPASPAWQAVITSFGIDALGQSKAALLVEHGRRHAPHIVWNSFAVEIADMGWGELGAADLLVTCTDSLISRVEAACAARMLGLPMLDAGVMGAGISGGRVACYATGTDAACSLCGLTAATRGALLEQLTSPSLSCAAMPLAAAFGNSVEGAVSVQATADLVALHLFGLRHSVTSVEYRIGSAQHEALHLSRSTDCPWHHKPRLLPLDDERPLRESLQENDDVLLLPWAMVLTAVCNSCGATCAIPRRLAIFHGGVSCAQCGQPGMLPVRTFDRIAAGDDIAALTPSQAGLPTRHVLPARKRIQVQRAS